MQPKAVATEYRAAGKVLERLRKTVDPTPNNSFTVDTMQARMLRDLEEGTKTEALDKAMEPWVDIANNPEKFAALGYGHKAVLKGLVDTYEQAKAGFDESAIRRQVAGKALADDLAEIGESASPSARALALIGRMRAKTGIDLVGKKAAAGKGEILTGEAEGLHVLEPSGFAGGKTAADYIDQATDTLTEWIGPAKAEAVAALLTTPDRRTLMNQARKIIEGKVPVGQPGAVPDQPVVITPEMRESMAPRQLNALRKQRQRRSTTAKGIGALAGTGTLAALKATAPQSPDAQESLEQIDPRLRGALQRVLQEDAE